MRWCGPVAGKSMIAAAIFTAPFVFILGLFLRDWIEARRWDDEEEYTESWTCEHCGYEAFATSIEGIIEGVRIHHEAIFCPGDDDDQEGHFR